MGFVHYLFVNDFAASSPNYALREPMTKDKDSLQRGGERWPFTYFVGLSPGAQFGMGLLVWSIATPYSRSLINKFAGLNISRALYSSSGAPLTVRAGLITL